METPFTLWLKKRRGRMAATAKALGVSRQAVHNAARGDYRIPEDWRLRLFAFASLVESDALTRSVIEQHNEAIQRAKYAARMQKKKLTTRGA